MILQTYKKLLKTDKILISEENIFFSKIFFIWTLSFTIGVLDWWDTGSFKHLN